MIVRRPPVSSEETYSIDAKRAWSKGDDSLSSTSSKRGRRVCATTWSGNWNADVRVIPGSAGFRHVTIDITFNFPCYEKYKLSSKLVSNSKNKIGPLNTGNKS